MTDLIVKILLLAALSAELVYILFRDPRVRYITVPFFVISIIITGYVIADSFTLINFVRLSALILLLASRIYLKNKPYEKPDYRYLLILSGTILIHI
ncbi:MAG: hypothetical protein JXN63_01535 [Candidatus Delongbacteria bacterium]|nr:hypothetical protein [Candidatus Delongbacteria bacterium]